MLVLGKTIVSIIAAYKAVKSGYQAAVMAPTAILASQHLEGFDSILKSFGIRCELLVSSITKKEKTRNIRKTKKRINRYFNWNTQFIRGKCSISKTWISCNRRTAQIWCKTKKHNSIKRK